MTQRADSPDTGRTNLAFATALVDALHAGGVTTAVVCPGSRSTPVALALARHAGFELSFLVDERSAAFFALGHARATGRPVALLCTSGTAGANFLPAVAEASQSRVPLVVLTADRPPELRAWGAPQTMEQRGLFAGFTRWAEEAPCPSEPEAGVRYAAALGARAAATCRAAPAGPVHLNLPFREPLVSRDMAFDEPATETKPTVHYLDFPEATDGPARSRDDAERRLPAGLASALGRVARGVVLFGPDAWEPRLAGAARRLAAALGWPVIADPASGLRAGDWPDGTLVDAADLLLKHGPTAAALCPEVVLRFGGPPTSKAVITWLAGLDEGSEVWLVDDAGAPRDPQHRASRVFRQAPQRFCALVADAVSSRNVQAADWLARWQRAGGIARGAARARLADGPFLAPQLAESLWTALPADAALYVANSMPIRDLDAFAGPRAAGLRVLANRGVNGIDGLLSCALGASKAGCRPTVLWCGDLAFLHDVAGLVTGRLAAADLTVVACNDDGGGIFEYLPISRLAPRPLFERVFAVPHGVDLGEVARGFGWQAARADSAAGFTGALRHALAGGRHVIEVPVDRALNTALHREVSEAVGAALERERPA